MYSWLGNARLDLRARDVDGIGKGGVVQAWAGKVNGWNGELRESWDGQIGWYEGRTREKKEKTQRGSRTRGKAGSKR